MSAVVNLPFKERKLDQFFAVIFVVFAITSGISDFLPASGIKMVADSSNPIVRANYEYAFGCDPLFLTPPVWMRFVTGLSAFVYGPFYLLLSWAIVKGKNWIQVPAIVYASMISSITGVIVFGVEFFGEPEWQCQNVPKFLSLNLPYVLIPLLLLARMRKHDPFTRKF
jgi:hypothetical protein